jgi:hypothetical protein
MKDGSFQKVIACGCKEGEKELYPEMNPRDVEEKPFLDWQLRDIQPFLYRFMVLQKG